MAEACQIVGAVQVYVVWAGEEGEPPKRISIVTPDWFGGDEFHFRESELLTVAIA